MDDTTVYTGQTGYSLIDAERYQHLLRCEQALQAMERWKLSVIYRKARWWLLNEVRANQEWRNWNYHRSYHSPLEAIEAAVAWLEKQEQA